MDKRKMLLMLGNKPFDYYIDSVNGNDANSGMSVTSAFKTIAALPTLTAGKRVGLARGSSWKEQIVLSATQNNVQIKAYGSGAAPILDCADVAASAGFTKTVGLTSVYQVSVSPAVAVQDTRVQAWENASRLVRATSAANCDAVAGSYFPSSDTSAPLTLYVHASDGSDPATNGKSYSFSSRTCGIDCFLASNTVIDGIETRNNLHDAGSLRLGKLSRATNCIARNGSKHNVYIRPGCYLNNVKAIEAYYDSSATMFVFNEDTPEGEGITYENCSAYLSTLSTIIAGYYGHSAGAGTFGKVIYTNCSGENLSAFANGLNCDLIEYNNCIAVNCNSGISCSTNVDVIDGNYDTNIFGIGTTVAGLTINISDGAIINTVDAPNPGEISITQNNTTISITDSTIGISTTAPYRIMYNGPTGLNITLLRNRFSVATDRTLYFNTAPDVLVSDYNTFGTDKFKSGVLYATLAAWVTGTGQDAHSTVG